MPDCSRLPVERARRASTFPSGSCSSSLARGHDFPRSLRHLRRSYATSAWTDSNEPWRRGLRATASCSSRQCIGWRATNARRMTTSSVRPSAATAAVTQPRLVRAWKRRPGRGGRLAGGPRAAKYPRALAGARDCWAAAQRTRIRFGRHSPPAGGAGGDPLHARTDGVIPRSGASWRQVDGALNTRWCGVHDARHRLYPDLGEKCCA